MQYNNDPNPDFVFMRPIDCPSQTFYIYSVRGNERFDFSKETKAIFDKIVHLFAVSAMLYKGQPLYGAYEYHFLKGEFIIEEITKEIIPTSKRANRLIAYLKKLRDEDTFFILSADLPTQDRMCAHLAMKAIVSGCVIESVAHYKQTWGVVNNKYRYLSFGRDGVEESIGESDKDLRVCRFCGKKKPETSFKKIAHAISEGLGNKILVCNEECDKCNNRLARVEENLMHYFDIKRAIKYIILGGRIKSNEQSLRQIIEQMITPGTLSYKYFHLHSFAEMLPTMNGYLTVDAAPVIYMQLRKMAKTPSLAADWLKWHEEEFS